jgi:hypothetical protein
MLNLSSEVNESCSEGVSKYDEARRQCLNTIETSRIEVGFPASQPGFFYIDAERSQRFFEPTHIVHATINTNTTIRVTAQRALACCQCSSPSSGVS